jgi:predicted enzyme related to lactoylglutathione lyase
VDALVNIDVPELDPAIRFYTAAFGLSVSRRVGRHIAELSGLPVRVYLLEKPAGSLGTGGDKRRYERHWTPVHLDIVVDDIEAAVATAALAGAKVETPTRVEAWGKFAVLSDPFGHGFCLIEFVGRGYDEIADGA